MRRKPHGCKGKRCFSGEISEKRSSGAKQAAGRGLFLSKTTEKHPSGAKAH
jgi:hypothetical protein